MPRRSDIEGAFVKAITRAKNGRVIVTTADFVRELGAVNWDWSYEEANRWIKVNTVTFRDITADHGDNKLWFQFNPNGGL